MTRAAPTPPPGTPEPDEPGLDGIREIAATHRGERGEVIAVLQDIQARHGHLPERALRTVAEETGRSLVDIYALATFYRSFSLKPRGKHVISACLGTACHVRGAPRVVEELERQLGVRPGETTEDRQFTLETVNCLGACALGPIVVVDGHYFRNVRKSGVADILDRARRGLDEVGLDRGDGALRLEVNCPRCNHSLMDSATLVDGRPSIRVTVGFGTRFAPVNLSSLYGSPDSVCGAEVPPGAACRFFCPRCHGELVGLSRCAECGGPMAPMIVRRGGMVHVCTRRGCPGHRLDLDGVNA